MNVCNCLRGKAQAQPDFLTVVNLNAAVPARHPLRAIKSRMTQPAQIITGG